MSEVPELPHLIEKKKNVVKGGRYGHIPELPVGTRFEDRRAMYECGMHASLQAGIQGRGAEGACSVVLSGGYEDDVDLGNELYTGHGGQLPLQKKDRSQKKDQEWVLANKALKVSCKLRKPVRVIRGHRLHSNWAPAEGYRYDGLYNVTECGRKPGRSGFLVCLFRFERCPGQLPLPQPTCPSALEHRTLRHISPSSPTPPPTPRIPRKRRTSDASQTPIKRRALTADRPMFVQGSSTTTTTTSTVDRRMFVQGLSTSTSTTSTVNRPMFVQGSSASTSTISVNRPMFVQGSSTSTSTPSIPVRSTPYEEGPPDLRQVPAHMSPDSIDNLSEGTPSYRRGKRRAVEAPPASVKVEAPDVEHTDDWDDMYVSEEPEDVASHIAPETSVKAEVQDYESSPSDASRATSDTDDNAASRGLSYPSDEQGEMATQKSVPMSPALQNQRNEGTPEEDEEEETALQYPNEAGTVSPVSDLTESDEFFRYEDDESAPATLETYHKDEDGSNDDLEDEEEEGEEEEHEKTVVLRYGIKTASQVRQQSESDEVPMAEEEQEEVEEDTFLQYSTRTAFHVGHQTEIDELFNYEDDDIAPAVFKPYFDEGNGPIDYLEEDEVTYDTHGTSSDSPDSPFHVIGGLYSYEATAAEDTQMSPDPGLAAEPTAIEDGELPDVASPAPSDASSEIYLLEDGEVLEN